MVELQTMHFNKEFFQSEIRNGFEVSTLRKEVWAVEMDLLSKFIKVCEKYGLTYFAESGTLLGAVRHRGFVPWDDDIDVTMPRKDYDILCSIAKENFNHPYFFQTEYTDPGSARDNHAQLRNSDTTGILYTELQKQYRFNQGIFIDIFPLDELPPARERKEFFETLKELRENSYKYTYEVMRVDYAGENIYYKQLDCLVKKYRGSGSKKIGMISYSLDKRPNIRDAGDYATVVMIPFENMSIAVPIGYKNVLRTTYGIWKVFDVGSSGHGSVFFDTEYSYTRYVRR